MAAEATVRRKFQVIKTKKRTIPRPEDFLAPEHQANLFPTPRRGLMVFVYFPDVTEEEFRAALEYARPSSIVELRPAPRFDIGTLNRKTAFHAFQNHNSTYIDLALPGNKTFDPGVDAIGMNGMVWQCKAVLKDSRMNLGRPLMFLMNKSDAEQGLSSALRQLVSALLPDYNELFEVPHFSQA
jgi:hypothetical protein